MIYYDGKSDMGYERTIQEDAINVTELDDDTKLLVIADGSGGLPNQLSCGDIVAAKISQYIKDIFEINKEALLNSPESFLTQSLKIVNDTVGMFRIANEEKFAGFGCSVTACLIYNDTFSFAHSGNTRLYIIRTNKKKDETVLKLLTNDHTRGYEAVLDGKLDLEKYYTSPDRLVLTSCIGVFSDPEIQTLTAPIKQNDIIVMTTKGIHFAIKQSAIFSLVVASQDTSAAVNTLIEGAKSVEYSDNMSTIIAWNK